MEPAGVCPGREKRAFGCFRTSRTTARCGSPPPFFATQKAAVEAAGYEAGEGFIKLPYSRVLPTDLLEALMQARVEEYTATGAGWNDR